MKICSACRTPKPERQFYKDRRRKDGLYPQCRLCASESKKTSRRNRTDRQRQNDQVVIDRWRRENPERVHEIDRGVRFRKKYGISITEYDAMLEAQGGVCKLCGAPEFVMNVQTGRVLRLAVDHCHKSKRVRGLLCANCNRGIGFLKHDPQLLLKAAEYVAE